MGDILFCKKNGFTFSVNSFSREVGDEPYQTLVLNRKSIFKKGINYALKNNIDKLEVVLDLTEEDLALLKHIPLKELTLRNNENNIDISIINEFKTLEYFCCYSVVHGEIDLLNLQKLKGLRYDAKCLDIINFERSIGLKELGIHNYRRKELMSFGNSNIEEFFIHQSTITNLDALANCKLLKKVTVEYNRFLSSIDGIKASANSLECLELRNCKRFANYGILRLLGNLKDLYLCNCGSMENTSFFTELKNLEYGYIDINILDGNVDLLMQMPIIFKNYSHFIRKNNLKIKVIMNDGNYLVRNKQILYKISD